MYIKIKGTEPRRWWLFETNGYLQYALDKQKFTTYDEIQHIDQKIQTDQVILSDKITDHDFNNCPYEAFVITFTNSKNERVTVLFDTHAYICNNAGKTIETIKAR
jgi:hypothetical protein